MNGLHQTYSNIPRSWADRRGRLTHLQLWGLWVASGAHAPVVRKPPTAPSLTDIWQVTQNITAVSREAHWTSPQRENTEPRLVKLHFYLSLLTGQSSQRDWQPVTWWLITIRRRLIGQPWRRLPIWELGTLLQEFVSEHKQAPIAQKQKFGQIREVMQTWDKDETRLCLN